MWRSDEFTMENVMTKDNTTTEENDKYVFVKPDGGEIWCYGSVEWDSNFQICCDDEETYNTWDKVCQYVIENYRADIEEITAV